MRMLRDPAHCFKISSPLSRNCAPCETQCPTARMFECALPTTIVILLCAQLAAHLHRLWCAPHGTSSVLCTVSAIFLLALLSQGTSLEEMGLIWGPQAGYSGHVMTKSPVIWTLLGQTWAWWLVMQRYLCIPHAHQQAMRWFGLISTCLVVMFWCN